MTGVAAVLAALVGGAAPASAHTVSGVGATNFETVVTGVRPAVPGLTLSVIEDGNLLQLSNSTGSDVVVLGYQNEPYLRVGPAGVEENVRSTSTYINATRAGNSIPPPSADDTAAPVWRTISSAPVAQWHDHSSHYMLTTLPPAVQARPQVRQVVSTWTVVARLGSTGVATDRSVTWDGQLLWVPGPTSWPWWVVAGVLGFVAVGLTFTRRWRVLLGVAGLVLVVADVTHSTGITLDKATGRLGAFASGNLGDGLAWIGVLAGAALTVRRHVGGLFVLGAAALVVGVVGGAGDAATLSHSTAPFAWPLGLARALVAVTLGLGVGLTLACVLGVRRHDREADRRAPAPAPETDHSLDVSADLS